MAADGNKTNTEFFSLLNNVEDGYPSKLGCPDYILPEAGSSFGPPNIDSNPDELFSDYNVGLDQHCIDSNNNIQFCKKEVILDNSFENMINDTYESLMQTHKVISSASSVIQPSPKLFSSQEPPVARSSPKVRKFKHIHPKPQQTSILAQVPKVLCNPNQMFTKIPLPSPDKMVTMHNVLPGSSFSEPRSYTWKGLQGGLQRNTVGKQRETASCSSLATWPIPFKVLQPVRKLLPKPILSFNQHPFKRVASVRPNNRVSLLKSAPTSITKNPSTFHLVNHHSSLNLSPVKHTVYKPQTLKLKVVKEEKLPVISPSGWVTREDPSKLKKNEVERERRLEMAIYRENLRKMVPRTKDTVKVASVVILDAAKEYCEKIQTELHELELLKLDEERRQEILTWRLARMKYQLQK